ncbi:MAG: glutathione S-transferase N-terminal domain-containing protein [Methyloceanibacter sp.]
MTMAEGIGMAATGYTLVIGDKNYSSWSLRPWLALRHCGIPFAEQCVSLRQPESKAEILRHSPSGKVPVLKTETGAVWDSLAILEYVAERHPEHQLWPQDSQTRAAARCASCEMHSGMTARRSYGDGGPFLFGAFSNADAMFAPVATRFRTYGVDLASFGDDGSDTDYAERIFALAAMAEWTVGAKAEIRELGRA